MKFVVRKYYSGFCSHEVEADNEDKAYAIAQATPIKYDEVLSTLEDWEECNEVQTLPNS